MEFTVVLVNLVTVDCGASLKNKLEEENVLDAHNRYNDSSISIIIFVNNPLCNVNISRRPFDWLGLIWS